MTAPTILPSPGADGALRPVATPRGPGLVAFAASLVLAAATGLPRGSAARLIPRADDRDGPFLGI